MYTKTFVSGQANIAARHIRNPKIIIRYNVRSHRSFRPSGRLWPRDIAKSTAVLRMVAYEKFDRLGKNDARDSVNFTLLAAICKPLQHAIHCCGFTVPWRSLRYALVQSFHYTEGRIYFKLSTKGADFKKSKQAGNEMFRNVGGEGLSKLAESAKVGLVRCVEMSEKMRDWVSCELLRFPLVLSLDGQWLINDGKWISSKSGQKQLVKCWEKIVFHVCGSWSKYERKISGKKRETKRMQLTLWPGIGKVNALCGQCHSNLSTFLK